MLIIIMFTFIYYVSLMDRYINPLVISRLSGLGLTWAFIVWVWGLPLKVIGDITFFNNSFSFCYGGIGYSLTGFFIFLAILYLVINAVCYGKGILYPYYRETIKGKSNEFVILVLVNVLGVISMYSFSDYIVLFLGVEIVSLSSYVISCRYTNMQDSKRITNTLLYFIVSSIGTICMLLGIILIYYITGSVKLEQVSKILETGVVTISKDGLVSWSNMLIVIGIMIKAGISPFHSWSLELYSKNYVPVTFWMYSFTKLSYLPIVMFIVSPIVKISEDNMLISLLITIGITNVVIGSVSGYLERNLIRLLIFSSLSHSGYMIISMVYTNSVIGISSFVFYIVTYSLVSFVLLYLTYITKAIRNRAGYSIDMLSNMWSSDRWLSLLWITNIVSLIGIPPMIGFFSKFYVLTVLYSMDRYALMLVIIMGSVISSYYYLWLIVNIFSKSVENEIYSDSSVTVNVIHKVIVTLLTLYVSLYIMLPYNLYDLIEISIINIYNKI